MENLINYDFIKKYIEELRKQVSLCRNWRFLPIITMFLL